MLNSVKNANLLRFSQHQQTFILSPVAHFAFQLRDCLDKTTLQRIMTALEHGVANDHTWAPNDDDVEMTNVIGRKNCEKRQRYLIAIFSDSFLALFGRRVW